MRDSLVKVFAVLDVVASSDGAVTLKDIAAATGYNPSTLSRILSNLVESGCVRKESYRSFSLDLGLIPLGQQALSHFPLPKVANPMIQETAQRLGVQGALTGLHRGRVVYLYRTRLNWEPGILADDFRYPLHRSNCGLVMLASSEDSEARQWLEKSLDDSRRAEMGRQAAADREDKHKGRKGDGEEQRSATRWAAPQEKRTADFADGADREGEQVIRGRIPALVDQLMERVHAVRQDGYSRLIENPGWNVAFPLSFRGRAFSVALHESGAPPDNMDKIVLECSLLARRIDAAARELG